MHNMYMRKVNVTDGEDFILLGFGKLENRVSIFIIFLMIYIATLSGNNLIILLVSRTHQLHTPMYVFLLHLSICDILFTTNIVPSMLHIILEGVGVVPIHSCIAQFYVYGASTIAECFILTAMSYDRHLAICKPLHYTSTMDISFCLKLVGSSWLLGALSTLNTVLMIFTLDFCGPLVIDHFICDVAPLIKLSCSDTFMVELAIFLLSFPLVLTPFVFIIVTYICIFIAILDIQSASRRQKTFSTCSSHLTSVSVYYGILIIIYVVPSRGHFININKVLFLMYTVVTPLFNPIIYSLKNHEMRKAIKCSFIKEKV
ncbi:olfactory receptor 10P22-like [Leptodactylus fuscus]|uniref:olfactory receptor 10P22-like n=1 Tax=Leptodactylus fuscus TaxID=238119 RepID=UPI003F4E489A